MAPGSKADGAAADAVKDAIDRADIDYPWWFGGSASCFAVCLTHPLDLSKAFLIHFSNLESQILQDLLGHREKSRVVSS
ncbi:hypothetical protein BDZ85DRAFT_265040 [Elsinoe ampelina]|uniref:Uncharacterized protein n=1 Tax=Elsinoe ampelina TaxID=302913 RepID=A0A6A6G8U6_9PEZI|nr:hypothetical protein BDZ85DRAFT_265040 [Elsinoe ampelina]